MYDYSLTVWIFRPEFEISGARPHRIRPDISPLESEILMFMLCVHLIECYIINATGSLAMNILYIYNHSVINEVWNLL
jgi:hypothetical protein